MAHIAGYRRRYAQGRTKRRQIKTILAVVVVLVIAVVAYKYMSPKAVAKPPAPVQLTYSSRQSYDVDVVAGAVGQYATANGALPTRLVVAPDNSLVLCGASCGSTTLQVGALSVYAPSNIKLVAYAPSLSAPNQNVMYLVPQAKCGANGEVGSPNPNPRSMVILYASLTGTTTEPRCVVL